MCNGRLIGNRMWPIEWHRVGDPEWPWRSFPKVIPPLQAFSSAIRRTFAQHFNRFQLTALHDKLSPKWAWLRSRDCLKFWANTCIIPVSRKRYKIETYFQWKTNRKSYMAYRMAPVLVTLNDLEGYFPMSFALCRRFQVQFVAYLRSILTDFNWQHYMTNCPPR